MTQYSINIFGNEGPVNLSFREIPYQLLNNEILLGQTGGFPVKKDIGGLINFQDQHFDGFVAFQDNFTLKPSTPYNWNVKSWVETVFDEDLPAFNSGVSFIIDVFLAFNHLYDDEATPLIKHYAGSAHKRLTFSLYRSKVSAGTVKYSGIDVYYQNGIWIEYNSSTTPYASIANSGSLSDSAFSISLVETSSPQTINLKIENNLQSETGFSSSPDYEAKGVIKVRAYELSQDDHTIELIR